MEARHKEKLNPEALTLNEKLVVVRRVTKVVKGGRRRRFSALVVVGDGQGHVGVGLGKANEVPEAVRKANYYAKRALITVPLAGTTIPHVVIGRHGAAEVMLKPAQPGTGVIAAGGVRAVLEAAGVKDILTKSLGSRNPINVTQAAVTGLGTLRDPKEEAAKRKQREVPGQAREGKGAQG